MDPVPDDVLGINPNVDVTDGEIKQVRPQLSAARGGPIARHRSGFARPRQGLVGRGRIGSSAAAGRRCRR
jgi:hypothetical protein